MSTVTITPVTPLIISLAGCSLECSIFGHHRCPLSLQDFLERVGVTVKGPEFQYRYRYM